MTPQEKAQELVAKMEKDFQYFASREIAIQHALIAVDEIILEMNNVMVPNPFKQYWNEVKQEIKQL
jgi:hypothetical protein